MDPPATGIIVVCPRADQDGRAGASRAIGPCDGPKWLTGRSEVRVASASGHVEGCTRSVRQTEQCNQQAEPAKSNINSHALRLMQVRRRSYCPLSEFPVSTRELSLSVFVRH